MTSAALAVTSLGAAGAFFMTAISTDPAARESWGGASLALAFLALVIVFVREVAS